MASNPSQAGFQAVDPAFCPVDTTVTPRVAYAPQIPINRPNQDIETWCWAAVGLEICRTDKGAKFPSNPTQESLVAAVLKDQEDENKPEKAREVAWTLFRLHKIEWIKTRYRPQVATGANRKNVAQDMMESIRRGWPVSIVIDWGGAITHNVCAHGYVESEDGSVSFWIYDPAKNDQKSDNLCLLSSHALGCYPLWDPETHSRKNGWFRMICLPRLGGRVG